MRLCKFLPAIWAIFFISTPTIADFNHKARGTSSFDLHPIKDEPSGIGLVVNYLRVGFNNLELPFFALWVGYKTQQADFSSIEKFTGSFLSSFDFLDKSAMLRAGLLGASSLESRVNWESEHNLRSRYKAVVDASKRSFIDPFLQKENDWRDQIYGALVFLNMMCKMTGKCAKDGIGDLLLEAYYPGAQVVTPSVKRLRYALNDGTWFEPTQDDVEKQMPTTTILGLPFSPLSMMNWVLGIGYFSTFFPKLSKAHGPIKTIRGVANVAVLAILGIDMLPTLYTYGKIMLYSSMGEGADMKVEL